MIFDSTSRQLLLGCVNRAIVYSRNGDPSKVLTALSYGPLPPPSPNTVNLRFVLAPINPADLNVIEGVYPTKPNRSSTLSPSRRRGVSEDIFVGGNEGLARVSTIGSGVSGFKKGDWVVVTGTQIGTWCTSRNVAVDEIVKVPQVEGLSEVHAATMTVNPPTAYNLLRDFVSLREGDWLVQNGANSAVGQAVIQIAASRALKTLNFVRARENLAEMVNWLQELGATKVLTYDALSDKSFRNKVREWTGGKTIQLGLNCVGGTETMLMTRLLGDDAHLVSYGAMSKQPLSLPTSLFIFKNLTTHGFWQSRWYQRSSQEEKGQLMQVLVKLMSKQELKEPMHEIVTIPMGDSDGQAGQRIRDIIMNLSGGRYGKKVLLNLESVE